MKNFSVQTLCTYLNGETVGKASLIVSSPERLEIALPHQITFIGHKKFEKLWSKSKALVAIVNKNITIEPGKEKAFIKVDNVELAMCRLLELFAPDQPVFDNDIHPSAIIHPTAKIGKTTRVGAGVYIGAGCILGDAITIYPNVTLLDECTIGDNTIIWPGTVIRERCKIGNNSIIHSNATIGADGFGFIKCPEKGLVKVPHIGNVIIGNNVEIGAATCIDRAKFSSTIIGDGCKIDNLVQIGHNCIVGKYCIIAGNSGLAGSVTLGNGVIIGGGSSIKDHVTLGDGVTVGGGSGVVSDIPARKTVLGYPAIDGKLALKQWAIMKNEGN